jgi:predicted DNA-binding protein (MmcQ/YjbR family)
MSEKIKEAQEELLKYALSFPEAYEDHPWGELVLKVNKKIFVFMGVPETHKECLGLGVKLPMSGNVALQYSFIEPMGYGLGRSGWVSIRCCKEEELPPLELFQFWIEESYRSIAPKKLLVKLPTTP